MEWNKDRDWRGVISQEESEKLYERGYIEGHNLLPCDLDNGIHPIFDAKRFTDLSPKEYNSIQPALQLATRLITDDAYRDFWLSMLFGRTKSRRRRGKQEEYIIPDPAHDDLDDTYRWEHLKWMFSDLAERITFFVKDAEWSKIDRAQSTVGDTFPDPASMNCKREDSVNKDGCNNCSYCQWNIYPICPTCCNRAYHCWKGEEEEKELAKECFRHSTVQPRTRAAMIKRLDAVYDKKGIPPKCIDPNEQELNFPRLTVGKGPLDRIRIGILNDIYKPLREPLTWTQTQHMRFQFSLAANLVHELVHAFWLLVSRRCWRCFGTEPWHSELEYTTNFGMETAELGNSWEYWAFGTRIPQIATFRVGDEGEEEANVLQKGLWSYVWSLPDAGLLGEHNAVLPVSWIHSWFREKTWQTIADKGRVDGRPGFKDVVFLKGTFVGEDPGSEIKIYRQTVEDFAYADLVKRGGFI